MQTVKDVRVFVGSSKDVQDERDRMPDVVRSVNRLTRPMGVVFHDWRYEADASPALHRDGWKGIVWPELDVAEVVVLVAWNQFREGTQAELERAYARFEETGAPHILPYFSTRPSVLDTEEACEERKAVLRARKWFDGKGLYRSYAEPEDFARLVTEHLIGLVEKLR
ncbi:MAG: hypothetical protein RIT81_24300 [Deltaproteobacteria bacterium]